AESAAAASAVAFWRRAPALRASRRMPWGPNPTASRLPPPQRLLSGGGPLPSGHPAACRGAPTPRRLVRRRAEPDGELGRASEQGARPPTDRPAIGGQLEGGEAAQQRTEGDLGLHAGQGGAEAEVDAVTEAEVGVVLPGNVELVG